MVTKKKTSEEIQVVEVKRKEVEFCVLGTSPLILNRIKGETARELLLPSPRKNAAQRATQLKHDPFREFRDAAYKSPNPKDPTLLLLQATAFKGALCSAALDVPGASKAAIGRLTYVEGDFVHVYGTPKLHMSIVRMADVARTPDVRTRVIVPQWACRVAVSFAVPMLNETTVTRLMAAAGITQGVGDYRTQKGKGNYGGFKIVSEDDPEYKAVLKQGRKGQEAAIRDPEPYDQDAAELLEWFREEAERREFATSEHDEAVTS